MNEKLANLVNKLKDPVSPETFSAFEKAFQQIESDERFLITTAPRKGVKKFYKNLREYFIVTSLADLKTNEREMVKSNEMKE